MIDYNGHQSRYGIEIREKAFHLSVSVCIYGVYKKQQLEKQDDYSKATKLTLMFLLRELMLFL